MNETMLYVVAYDIANDRRRTKVHKTLEGYGRWTQFSLFECYLTRQQLLLLQHALHGLIKANEDSLRFYRLCAQCERHVETIGSDPPHDDQLIIL